MAMKKQMNAAQWRAFTAELKRLSNGKLDEAAAINFLTKWSW